MITVPHTVKLPYPPREGTVHAFCHCGQAVVTYTWGQFEKATSEAEEHIREADHSEPRILEWACGDRHVVPGISL